MMALVDPTVAILGDYDLCVVGAGAAGLALAFSARAQGLSVLVVERGGIDTAPNTDAARFSPGTAHDPMSRIARCGVGGTLDIWGRRCVPLDREDFDRDGPTGWPISHAEYARWVGPAAEWLGVPDTFAPGPPAGWPEMPQVCAQTAEALCPASLPGDLRRRCMQDADAPDLLVSAMAVALDWTGHSVTGVAVRHSGLIVRISVRRVVLAGGGLPSVRLLLAEAARHPGRLTGAGHLGQGYMGHLTGSVATLAFDDPARARAFAYTADRTGTPWRRRLLSAAPGGPRVAFWLESPDAMDPVHRSGELSLKALLRGGAQAGQAARHMRNIATDPAGALSGLGTRVQRGAERPDRLVPGLARYRLAYHAEHLRETRNRVRLAYAPGRHELPQLDIAFGFGDETVDGVIAAHRTLASALSGSGTGRVEIAGDDDVLARQVMDAARDGYHQLGLARMAARPEHGVVDPECRVFGTDNLYVASSAVFPTASQANPTLTIVALALRLACHLASRQTVAGPRKDAA